jgi:putative spermidine/putrescine transport system ATP-binding protein
MASVSLRALSKVYDGVAAVKEFNMEIGEGEFVVLLGPSGCGKTTTLRMIAGFVEPSAGSVVIGSDDVTWLLPRKRNIGMVFQDYALFPNMTVSDNIGFGLRERGVAPAERRQRVAELLALIQLERRAEAYPDELSGGQQQRVALARAIAARPRVLLMDEPLGALDLKLREAMQIELQRLQRELKITTVLVTHDQQEAMTLADRIVIMAGGEIQQVGTPHDLYNKPANRFVADFVGKNNILAGRIVESGPVLASAELADGVVVRLAPPRPLLAGDAIELSIRPEQLKLRSGTGNDENTVTGAVETRTFLGSVSHYFVRLSWGPLLLVECPAGSETVEIGSEVRVGWHPANAVCFAPSRSLPA